MAMPLHPLSELLGVARRVVHGCCWLDVVAAVVTTTNVLLQEVSRNCVPVRLNFDYSPHRAVGSNLNEIPTPG
ncbi:hypothetical protein [Paraflavitalea soli]|uniref:hypothetical protein n=1 Tax=Paraflavitalea soli TaxID=2315862 RepID=UPI0013C4F853|nr:hypothetical protein [Paraflavitalea soli]